jgi:hypothetical protein
MLVVFIRYKRPGVNARSTVPQTRRLPTEVDGLLAYAASAERPEAHQIVDEKFSPTRRRRRCSTPSAGAPTGQLWAYARDDFGGAIHRSPSVYAQSRKSEQPLTHLICFAGVLQIDALPEQD